MEFTIKPCSCKQCKANKAARRKKDKIVSRATNKAIRQENNKVIRDLLNGKEDAEIDFSRFQGYYWA